jgi:peptidoglycan hydrolase-like protein with peptidoglycan-binding domain
MNRLLATGTALAVALGTVGLAQAQSTMPSTPSAPGSSMPGTASPGVQSPSSPGMQTPSTTSPGVQGPQANTQGQANVSPSTVQLAQQELKSKGLYNGPIDGIAGPETQTAISQFQRQNGLPQTAMLDQQTLDRLVGNTGGTTSPPSTTRY